MIVHPARGVCSAEQQLPNRSEQDRGDGMLIAVDLGRIVFDLSPEMIFRIRQFSLVVQFQESYIPPIIDSPVSQYTGAPFNISM